MCSLLCRCRFVAGTSSADKAADENRAKLRDACVCVTTFNMIAHGGKRSEYGKQVGMGLRGTLALG